MNDAYAHIVVRRHEVLPGMVYETYEWQGDSSAPVAIDTEMEYLIPSLPWPLRRTQRYLSSADAWLWRRTDGANALWALWASVRVVLGAAWQHIERRLLFTAFIWLGHDWHESHIPAWRMVRWPWLAWQRRVDAWRQEATP